MAHSKTQKNQSSTVDTIKPEVLTVDMWLDLFYKNPYDALTKAARYEVTSDYLTPLEKEGSVEDMSYLFGVDCHLVRILLATRMSSSKTTAEIQSHEERFESAILEWLLDKAATGGCMEENLKVYYEEVFRMLRAVRVLRYDNVMEGLFIRSIRLIPWARSCGSAYGRDLDILDEFARCLVDHQEDASLAHFWLWLSREAAEPYSDDKLDIAARGMSKCPVIAYKDQEGVTYPGYVPRHEYVFVCFQEFSSNLKWPPTADREDKDSLIRKKWLTVIKPIIVWNKYVYLQLVVSLRRVSPQVFKLLEDTFNEDFPSGIDHEIDLMNEVVRSRRATEHSKTPSTEEKEQEVGK